MASVTILSDNGATSGSAGLKTSGGNDGVLLLQTTTSGGTPTTAISIDNTQTVTFTNQPTYTGGTANGVLYLNGSKAVTSGTALVFDGTNLGLGVTPSAWISTNKAFQFGYGAVRAFTNSANTYLDNNNYVNSSGTDIYLNNGYAGRYRIADNQHIWYQAASGTAGATISFTQAMTLDANGKLLIGATSSLSSGGSLQVQTPTAQTNAVDFLGANSTSGNAGAIGMFANNVYITSNWYYAGAQLKRVSGNGVSNIVVASGPTNADTFVSLGTGTTSDTSPTERARIDSSGRMTTPYQTFAHVAPPASYSLPAGETVIGGTWTSITNTGSNFNLSTGVFTAPVAGVYNIVWSCFFNSTTTARYDVFINVNGVGKARQEQQKWATTAGNNTALVAVSIYLAANDQVSFGVYAGSTTTIYLVTIPWSYASIYLLG